MPSRLKRFQESGQSHFVTFCCYRRRRLFATSASKCTFEWALERVRRSYDLAIYGYVVMPEHIHLLVSEPPRKALADAIKSLKQGVSRRWIGEADHFWQKRYYDFNIRNHRQFVEKLRYIHRNPVKHGLCERAEDWNGAAFDNTLLAAVDEWRLNASGRQGSASEQQVRFAHQSSYPTQAKIRLEWATRPVR